jgi:gamma-glutamyltranspeptidase / glutathione hydrolase
MRKPMRLLLGLVVVPWCVPVWGHVAEGERGMVATGHPVATEAAVKVMEEGGNAIDAAVAAALMLGVVDGHNSGIGGGCFMLVRLADGSVYALDGREMAPAAAERDMFVIEGEADTRLSQTGPLASGIPGSVKVYSHAVEEWGNKSLGELILPAAEVAERGFEVNRSYAGRLRSVAGGIAQFEESRRILLKEDGRPYEQGETIRMPDLAATYRAIAEHGGDWFYTGEFAQKVEQWMRENGGIITAEDFADYEMKQREPIRTSYRGYEIIGFPPPSSGGVHVAQILSMLERFDVAGLEDEGPAERVHVIAEAMKLAFADRAYWLGDPDFAEVPKGLIDEDYLRELAGRINQERARAVESHGQPPGEAMFGNVSDREGALWHGRLARVDVASTGETLVPQEALDKHTTHIAAADAEGNWVAITATVNTAFGSKVIIPGTGVVMNNQMDDFSVRPGVPNIFGLIGAEANAIEPGKRPLSSMSPTIVLRDGEPVMTLGAAGGPRIITQVVLAISNHVDLGDELEEAVGRRRFHHQWVPDQLSVERGMDEQIVQKLEEKGHTTESYTGAGVTQAIWFDAARGVFIGVAEPRSAGTAGGVD